MQHNSSFLEDISRSEYSESAFFFHPPKSSSPIEIPGRHDEPQRGPERTISPDLIFEMEFEPFSLDRDRSSSTNYYSFNNASPAPTTSRNKTATEKDDRDRERPLLYTFPVITRTNADRAPDRPTTPQRQSTASLSLPPMSHKPPPRTHRRTHTQLETPSQTPTAEADAQANPAYAIRAVPRHKITGFTPEFPAATTAPEPRARPPTQHLKAQREREKPRSVAPSHRRRSSSRSFSSRPWLLPGGGGASISDDELSRSLDVDYPGGGAGGQGGGGSGGDFTQYLLRRIDSQKPLYHFPAFQAMMSVSVR
ncbi:hypothetical protein C8R45DRAFT_1106617 [Mycena sanguinolenta]|nr:hypothetical protein C8R45DRAFT_1106617 [Mycena sanguinolenta]